MWLLLLTKENASLAFRGASGSCAVNTEHRASHSDLHFSSCLANVIKIHSLATSCAYTDTYVWNPAADISSHSSRLRKTNGEAHTPTKKCVKIRGMWLYGCGRRVGDKKSSGDFSSFFFLVTSVSLNLGSVHTRTVPRFTCMHTNTHTLLYKWQVEFCMHGWASWLQQRLLGDSRGELTLGKANWPQEG